MKRAWVLGILVAVGMSAAMLAEQGQKPVLPMTIEKVKDNLYMISGAGGGNTGGNTAVYVAANGVVLVDTKYANYGQPILDQVKTVTNKPVTHIINTHTHGDHVGSNDFFPASVEIVAHENTAANMAKMQNFADAAAKHGLPDRTFSDRVTLLSGNDSIDIYYFGRAHTDGDAFIVFRNARTMHAGDAFPGQRTPLMDGNNGGSGVNYPATLAKAAAGIKNVDTVIPGHSAVTNWQGFVDYGEFIMTWVTSVQGAAKAGKTADQALNEFVLPEKFKAYGTASGKANIELIYKEVQK